MSQEENLSLDDIESMIKYNKRLVEKGKEIYEPNDVHKELLYRIPEWMKAFNYIENKRERIVKKTAQILGTIIYSQPFFNANKRTALSFSRRYLIRNGFYLPINTRQAKKSIYDILFRTMMKTANDQTIFTEIEDYLRIHLIKEGSSLSNAS